MEKHISYCNGYHTPWQEKLHAVKDAGFDGIFFLFESDPEFYEAVDGAKRLGLKMDMLHLPFDDINSMWREGDGGDYFTQRLIAGVRYAGEMGIGKVVVHYVSKLQTVLTHSEVGVKRFEEVIAACRRYHVQFCFENTHHSETLDWLYANLPSRDELGFCLDSGHLNGFTHDTLAERWLPYFDRLTCVHLHDNNGKSDQHLLPFDGNLNWQYLMPAAFGKHPDVPLTLEFTENARTLHPSWDEKRFLQEAMDRALVLEKMIDDNAAQ